MAEKENIRGIITTDFIEVSADTKAKAQEVALEYAEQEIVGLSREAQWREDQNEQLFAIAARPYRETAAKWQQAVEKVKGIQESERDWSGVKNMLIEYGMGASYAAGVQTEGYQDRWNDFDQTKGLLVLAASLP